MLIIRGTWEVDGGNQSQNEESLNSGLEGEWKLHGEAEAGSREFAMREWGEAGVGNGKPVIAGGGGEWKLEPGGPGGTGHYSVRRAGTGPLIRGEHD